MFAESATTAVSNGPHKLAVRLLLYRGCHNIESLRHVVTQTSWGSSSSSSKQSKKIQNAEMWCSSKPIHRPQWPTHTHMYHSTHRTDSTCNVHTRGSGPHKLAVRLLLYRDCHKAGSWRAWGTVWYRHHDTAATAPASGAKKQTKLRGSSTLLHRPART